MLLLAGAKFDVRSKDGFLPIDHVTHNTPTWDVLHDIKKGEMPELEEAVDPFAIPEHALLVRHWFYGNI